MIPILLDLALTIPAVTEVRLKGFPTASTHSPNLSASESPQEYSQDFGLNFYQRDVGI